MCAAWSTHREAGGCIGVGVSVFNSNPLIYFFLGLVQYIGLVCFFGSNIPHYQLYIHMGCFHGKALGKAWIWPNNRSGLSYKKGDEKDGCGKSGPVIDKDLTSQHQGLGDNIVYCICISVEQKGCCLKISEKTWTGLNAEEGCNKKWVTYSIGKGGARIWNTSTPRRLSHVVNMVTIA